jgi:glycosyltransferase involved in cell wall biosynthesis
VIRRKRVLFVLPLILGWRTYASRIQSVVAEREDIEACFCTYSPAKDAQIWRRALVRRLPTPHGIKFLVHPILNGLAWGRRWLRRTRAQGGYDAIHIATATFAAAFVEQMPRTMPLSVAIDVTFRRPVRVMGAILRSHRADELEAKVYERADRLFPLSTWAGDSLVKDYGVPASKVCVMPPSVPIRRTEDKPARSDKAMVDVAFVGNPFRAKGGEDLLTVHQRYFRDNAVLHVVSRDFRPTEKLKNVVHHPFIHNDVLLNEFLPAMDVFCLPTHADMSSFATAEAAAAGLPSVVTETGGVSDLCIDGETGFLIGVRDIDSLADRLERLITDPGLRARQGRAAQQFAIQNLDARRNYNRLIDATLQATS